MLKAFHFLAKRGSNTADHTFRRSVKGAARRIRHAKEVVARQGRGQRIRQNLRSDRLLHLVRRDLKASPSKSSLDLLNKFDPFREMALLAAAATSIQEMWRGRRVSKFRTAARSVLILQSLVRRWMARRRIVERPLAVLGIQRATRGLLARMKLDNLINEKKRVIKEAYYAAAVIQSIARGRMVRTEMYMLQNSAVVVQKAVRAYMVRTAYRSVINRRKGQIERARQDRVRLEDALTIQRTYHKGSSRVRSNVGDARRMIGNKNTSECYQLTTSSGEIKATLTIQRLWKSFHYRIKFMVTCMSLVKIQAWWRSRAQRNCYKRVVVGVVLLQSWARGMISRRLFASMNVQKSFNKVVFGIVALQALTRGAQARRKMLSRAVVDIQRCTRSFLSRQLISLKRFAATAIQKTWRVQARRKILSCAVVDIQRCTRGFLARQLISLKGFAATAIQKTWRCYAYSTGYICVIVATIKIQGFVRMAKAKMRRCDILRQMRQVHDAAVKLQSLLRGVASRKATSELLRIRRAVVSVQSFQRRCLACRQASELRSAATDRRRLAAMKVQSLIRMRSQLLSHRKKKIAAGHIQSLYRGKLVRERLSHRKQDVAAIQLQCLYRGVLARKLKGRAAHDTSQLSETADSINGEAKADSISGEATKPKEDDEHRHNSVESASKNATTAQNDGLQDGQEASNGHDSRPTLSQEDAARTIQKAVRRSSCLRSSKRVFHRRLSLSQGMVRGWIARRQSNPEVRQSIVLIKEAEERSKLHPDLRLGARFEQALKVLKTSSSLRAIIDVVTTIELATRFSPECCSEFVQADATETMVALLSSCNKSLPHVELLFYIMQTLLNVCKHKVLVQHVITVETAKACLYLIRMYGAEEIVFCSAVALLDLCVTQNEDAPVSWHLMLPRWYGLYIS
jgi:abnormal spindle-like microcephaly-associated protein